MIDIKENMMKKRLRKLFRRFIAEKHKYPASTLIHRNTGAIVFEIEFNWYDEDFNPVSIVRQLTNQKIYSIRSLEMQDFKEYTGSNFNPGSSI